MSTNKKVITLTAIISFLTAILTYFVCVNIETGFISLNSTWISNNFLLTISGGIFTGAILSLIMELQKYWLNKRTIEDHLFAYLFNLYSNIFLMKMNIKDYINNNQTDIPHNMLTYRASSSENIVSSIKRIEYDTFGNKNLIKKKHNFFCKEQATKIHQYMQECINLEIAINTVQIENLKTLSKTGIATSENALINKTLKKLISNMDNSLIIIDDYLKTIDDSCNNRYSWVNNKNQIHSSYVSLFAVDPFEEFINKD